MLLYFWSPCPTNFVRLSDKRQRMKLEITADLKHHETIQDSFEFFESHIPFSRRSLITHLEYS